MTAIRLLTMTSFLASTMLFVAGCNPGGTPAAKDTKDAKAGGKKDAKKVDKHDHPHEGPHEGALAEWGEEEFHVEFTVDHKKQEARVYVLGPDSKKAAPIKSAKIMLSIKDPLIQIELKPEPQKDDPAGSASVFVGKHEKLAVEREFVGTLSGEVNGKQFAGDFKEDEHAGHKDKKDKK